MVFKSLALLVSLGSGIRGLLAPMFMASAAMGGVISHPAQHSFTRFESGAGRVRAGSNGGRFGVASRTRLYHFHLKSPPGLQCHITADAGP